MNLRDRIEKIIVDAIEDRFYDEKGFIDVPYYTDLILSIPITVDCEECKGKGYKKSHLVKTEIGNFFLYT